MKRLLVFILMNSARFKLCAAIGIVALKLSSYQNYAGLADDGDCCDAPVFPDSCNFFNYCEHYFIVCLDESTGSATDMNQCRIGRYRTAVSDGNMLFFGKTVGRHSNPTELEFYKWPDRVLVKVEVWDQDDGCDDEDDRVEFLSKEVQMEASRSRAERSWQDFIIKKRTQLKFSMAVFCDENWYGQRCDICKDGCDRYTTDGHKKCQENWFGHQCNIYCKPSDNEAGHYNCATDGHKKCHENWFGPQCDVNCKPSDNEDGHHSRTTNGHKKCPKNRFGPQCDVYCKPSDNENGHYNCTSDGHKKCHENWFGPQCDVYCKPSDNEDGHYNCTSDGHKKCHENWFGPQCDVYCKPSDNEDGHFSCMSDGHKQCHRNWYGVKCDVYCKSSNSEHTSYNCRGG